MASAHGAPDAPKPDAPKPDAPAIELELQRLLRSWGPVSVAEVTARVGAAPYHLHARHATLTTGAPGAPDAGARELADELVLFKYDHFKTNWAAAGRAAVEARGIILRYPSWDVACYPFDKFFNAGEATADELDWGHAGCRVVEKLDGSLMKLWHSPVVKRWVVSTNGTIDASLTPIFAPAAGTTLPGGDPARSFKDLFDEAGQASGLDYARLDEATSYFFELCHPEARVLIPHPRPRLVHLGARSNRTLVEDCAADIGVERPRVFDISSLQGCLEAAAQLEPEASAAGPVGLGSAAPSIEGFVAMSPSACGLYVRRVKIKTPMYVAAHHLRAKEVPKEIVCAEVLLNNEDAEVGAYGGDAGIRDFAATLGLQKARLGTAAARLAGLFAPILRGAHAGAATPADFRKACFVDAKAELAGVPRELQQYYFAAAVAAGLAAGAGSGAVGTCTGCTGGGAGPSPAAMEGIIRERFISRGAGAGAPAEVHAKRFLVFLAHPFWDAKLA